MQTRAARRRLPPRVSLVGQPAPVVRGADVAGEPAARGWDGGGRGLVAFLTGGCTTCQAFWDGFTSPTVPLGLPAVVVTPGAGTESRRGLATRLAGGSGAPVIMSTEAWLAYGVRGAPWFVVVADGKVTAEGPAASWDELRTLAATPPPAGPAT